MQFSAASSYFLSHRKQEYETKSYLEQELFGSYVLHSGMPFGLPWYVAGFLRQGLYHRVLE
jgi:hypothetical protein